MTPLYGYQVDIPPTCQALKDTQPDIDTVMCYTLTDHLSIIKMKNRAEALLFSDVNDLLRVEFNKELRKFALKYIIDQQFKYLTAYPEVLYNSSKFKVGGPINDKSIYALKLNYMFKDDLRCSGVSDSVQTHINNRKASLPPQYNAKARSERTIYIIQDFLKFKQKIDQLISNRELIEKLTHKIEKKRLFCTSNLVQIGYGQYRPVPECYKNRDKFIAYRNKIIKLERVNKKLLVDVNKHNYNLFTIENKQVNYSPLAEDINHHLEAYKISSKTNVTQLRKLLNHNPKLLKNLNKQVKNYTLLQLHALDDAIALICNKKNYIEELSPIVHLYILDRFNTTLSTDGLERANNELTTILGYYCSLLTQQGLSQQKREFYLSKIDATMSLIALIATVSPAGVSVSLVKQALKYGVNLSFTRKIGGAIVDYHQMDGKDKVLLDLGLLDHKKYLNNNASNLDHIKQEVEALVVRKLRKQLPQVSDKLAHMPGTLDKLTTAPQNNLLTTTDYIIEKANKPSQNDINNTTYSGFVNKLKSIFSSDNNHTQK